MTISESKIQFYFFITLFIIVIGFLIVLFTPFLSSIAVAFVIAIIFKPFYKKVLAIVKIPGLASILSILLILIIIGAPIYFLGTKVVDQLSNISQVTIGQGDVLGNGGRDLINQIPSYLQTIFSGFQIPTDFSTSLNKIYVSVVNNAFNNLTFIKNGTLSLIHNLLSIVLTFIILYFLFKDGSVFKEKVIKYSPLTEKLDKKIINKLELSINSIIRGAIFVALVQGTLAGIGMTIFGVPNSVLWGTLAAFGALIPGVGTAIIMFPAIIYLFLTSSLISTIGLLIWAVIIVGLVDNFLAPYLYSQGIKIHQVLILLSILGGLSLFGALGFIYGPLILSLFFTLLDMQKYFISKKN